MDNVSRVFVTSLTECQLKHRGKQQLSF